MSGGAKRAGRKPAPRGVAMGLPQIVPATKAKRPSCTALARQKSPNSSQATAPPTPACSASVHWIQLQRPNQ